ncbi:hypothetical protein CEXT_582401 [Caerostris extrusa]|uniref:Uncharacterized protein n=1 Tax=Caerostris extrusa TaxID=172846 RepID=A0AAV4QHD7_CAEEX|nr:hypothetical protein CEXT_582401 [Caerostris extrusa]
MSFPQRTSRFSALTTVLFTLRNLKDRAQRPDAETWRSGPGSVSTRDLTTIKSRKDFARFHRLMAELFRTKLRGPTGPSQPPLQAARLSRWAMISAMNPQNDSGGIIRFGSLIDFVGGAELRYHRTLNSVTCFSLLFSFCSFWISLKAEL